MTYSSLSFSATLPPFYYTSGYNTNYSNTNLSATGNLALSTTKDGITGQDYTTISSSVLSNGISYAESDATINGNLLTVNYISSNAIGSGTDLTGINLNGTGVNFSTENSTTNGSSVTTSYGTSANSNFGLSIPHAAISTGTSNSDQKIVLKSISVVGSTLTAVYELKDSISNNVTLAPHDAPATDDTSSVVPITDDTKKNPTFSTNGFNTIGDLLASTNGFTTRGTLNGALQPLGQGPNVGEAAPAKALLAAALNPAVNATPDSSFQVTDFVKTGLDTTSFGTATNAYNNSSSFGSSSNDSSFTSYSGSTSSFGTSSSTSTTSFYNSVGSANYSTIRGTGYSGTA